MIRRYSPWHPTAVLANVKKILFNIIRYPKRGSGKWHSWDPHPWKHPWLNKENLANAKAFSESILEQERKVLEQHDSKRFRFGFCGNIANTMYMRAVPLRAAGESVSIYIHPQDDYIMSQPCWEEYDGVLPEGLTSYKQARIDGINLPVVDDVWQLPEESDWMEMYDSLGHAFLRSNDLQRFSSYMSLLPVLNELQCKDALWSTQAVYMPYLANRPYIASQSGGDIWFEAARGDMLGELMRASFRCARLVVVSNPWTYAHARRYGLNNLVYMPKILDETVYCPGDGQIRQEWKRISGGDFFVLTSSRMDEQNKGSSIGLKGFAEFCCQQPNARLVVIGWGNDKEQQRSLSEQLGIAGKIINLSVSGKARLRDVLRSADVFLDQFVLGYYGSAGMEAMACGLPVIGRIEHEQYDMLTETGPPPILHAESPEQVARHLLDLSRNTSYLAEAGITHRRWLCDNHGARRWLDDYRAVLTATAVNWPLDTSQSPLCEPLSRQEKRYHAYGMAVSPPHPQYGW